MTGLFVLTFIEHSPWGRALEALRSALAQNDRVPVLDTYAALVRALVERRAPDLATAVAEDLLWCESAFSEIAVKHGEVPKGLRAAAQQDLDALLTQVARNWQGEASRQVGRPLPALSELAPAATNPVVIELAAELPQTDSSWLIGYLTDAYQAHGTGTLARFEAFRWSEGALQGIAHPVRADMNRLVALESQLNALKQNTLAFLSAKPAQHTLLYGPRGSGKSTAVRSLIKNYGAAGLRLIELAPAAMTDLPSVVEAVRGRPHRYIVFIDDLSFEQGDNGYQPLKTLLEGSLTERPENVLVYATSNRRHLVKEQFSDRPDPLNDDVHAWDTQNERLALADRFGLTITFPSATQTRYLEVVQGLVEEEGLAIEGLTERAVRFADWGNGYSGRTAQQFVDSLKAEQT